MSWVNVALVVGSTAISMYGSYQEGQDAQKAANYNATIEEQEAGLIRAGAARETDIIKQNAVLNEYRQRKDLETLTGRQVSGYAASGVSVGTGSPLDVIADSIATNELDISINKWNAENEATMVAYNAETGARGKESSATMLRRYGKASATKGMYKAGSTLLSSASTLYKGGKTKIGGGTVEPIGSHTGVRKY